MILWLRDLPTPVFWLLALVYSALMGLAGFVLYRTARRVLLWLRFGWAMRRFRRSPANVPPPVGARLVRPNGARVPLELGYVGDQDGIHVWAPVHPVLYGPGDQLQVDMLPGRTAITIPSDLEGHP